MNKVLATAIGAAALGALALPAAAQTSKPVGLSIRAGVAFPTTNNNGGNNTLFAAGLEYNLGGMGMATGMGMGGHMSISADYYGKNNATVVPILLNFVGTTSSPFYYTLGAGLAYDNIASNTNWNFAYRLGLGYNFAQSTTPVFIEANFFGNSNSNYNAIGVYLGVRL